jgi:hypothetical protein
MSGESNRESGSSIWFKLLWRSEVCGVRALALLGLRLRHGLDVSTEILPGHDLLDRLPADRPWR